MNSPAVPVVPLKRVAAVMPSNVDKNSEEGQQKVHLCNYVDVYKNERITDSIEFMEATATDAQIRKFTLQADDVIVTKDSEEPTDIGVPAYVPKSLPGIVCGYHLAVLRPSDERLFGGYLHWVVQSAEVQAYYATAATGISRYALGISELGMTPVYLPARSEQERIANFLDEQTARIDALIAEKERLIATIDELRYSTISQAVVVERNDWTQTRLKFLVHDIIDTEHKTVPFYDDGEYLVARTTNIKNGRLTLEGAKYTDAAGYEEWTRRAVPAPGDILFTREAPAGEACLVPAGVPLCLGQRTVLIRIDQNKADASFVLWSLYGGLAARFISDLSQGSTVAHFNMPDIGNIPLFTGPTEEQRERAALLEAKLEQVDSLKIHVTQHIARLREYRSSLISAAVTGQLDVSSHSFENSTGFV